MLKSLSIAVAVMVVLLGLSMTAMWRFVDQRSFDILSSLYPLQTTAPGAIIVAIDEPSMAFFEQQWPWPRRRHAALIEALRKAGAKVIAFDVIFADPSHPEDDKALAEAVGPDVVLAGEITTIITPQAVQSMQIRPMEMFLQSGASVGMASVVLDDDSVLRRLPPTEGSFARAMLDTLPAHPKPGSLIQFMGGARTYPTVSYYQALYFQDYLPKEIFSGRTVIVGLSLQNAATLGQADTFATPFTTLSGQLLPGVEVQATILDNLRHGIYVTPLPRWVITLIALVVAVSSALLFRIRISIGGVLALLVAILVALGASWGLLRIGRLWMPPLLPVAALTLVFASQGLRHYWGEARRRREIEKAFQQYLSPAMVSRLADNPESLQLGGEERTITVLFSDVRGFTSLSERLRGEPMLLTTILNRLLNPLTDAVLDRQGTIDKYIGDCLMAFWNAPLDDPKHADNAVRASQAMIVAVDELNGRFTEEGLPTIRIGVGINTGACVVGNMGSQRRFNYSALGDAVNIAARLEGACKLYEVNIVIGEDTVTATSDEHCFVEIDRLVVKGRNEDLAIFTLLDTRWRHIRQAHDAFLDAYRKRQWNETLILLADIDCPPLAAYYGVMQSRIENYRRQPPPPDWRGSFVADTK